MRWPDSPNGSWPGLNKAIFCSLLLFVFSCTTKHHKKDKTNFIEIRIMPKIQRAQRSAMTSNSKHLLNMVLEKL